MSSQVSWSHIVVKLKPSFSSCLDKIRRASRAGLSGALWDHLSVRPQLQEGACWNFMTYRVWSMYYWPETAVLPVKLPAAPLFTNVNHHSSAVYTVHKKHKTCTIMTPDIRDNIKNNIFVLQSYFSCFVFVYFYTLSAGRDSLYRLCVFCSCVWKRDDYSTKSHLWI